MQLSALDSDRENTPASLQGTPMVSPRHQGDPMFILDLLRYGAAAFQLREFPSYRKGLLEEASTYDLQKWEHVVGPHKVRQDVWGFEDFPRHSLFCRLMMSVELTLTRFARSFWVPLYSEPLLFNQMSLQRYPAGSIGITPHIDSKQCRNLICVLVIEGDGRFFVCEDREQNDALEIQAGPGDLLVMAAEGFCGLKRQRFHYLTDIEKGRLTFGFRQMTSKKP